MPRDPTAPPSRDLEGILYVIAAVVVLSLMDATIKQLTATQPYAQVVWARYCFHLAVLLPILFWRDGRHALRTDRPGLQVGRGVVLLVGSFLFIIGLSTLSLSDALALFFVSPLVATALSPLLGEAVGLRRWVAVTAGFAGALLIIRPGFGAFNAGTLFALAGGILNGVYVVMTRKVAGTSPQVSTAYTALAGSVIMSGIVPFVWSMPTPGEALLLAASGILAGIGHLLFVTGLDRAPASLVAPYMYFGLVMSTIWGFVFFGHFPDALSWLGMAVIALAGIRVATEKRR